MMICDISTTIKTHFAVVTDIPFRFTGLLIQDENVKEECNDHAYLEMNHRYSIADGISDKNVLGFDPYKVLIFKDKGCQELLLHLEGKCKTVEEVINNPEKSKIYYYYMDSSKVKMASHTKMKMASTRELKTRSYAQV